MQSRSTHNADAIRQDLQVIGNTVNQLQSKSASKHDLAHYISQFAQHIGRFQCPPTTAPADNEVCRTPHSASMGVVTPTTGVCGGPYKLESHKSIASICDEWYGLAKSNSEGINGREGGIRAMEATFKSKWRSHFSPAEAKQFSRMKFIVNVVSNAINNSNKAEEEVLMEYESLFKICKSSLFKMEQVLKGRNTHWNTTY